MTGDETNKKCVCGEYSPDRLVVHRTDGPCYLRESQEPVASKAGEDLPTTIESQNSDKLVVGEESGLRYQIASLLNNYIVPLLIGPNKYHGYHDFLDKTTELMGKQIAALREENAKLTQQCNEWIRRAESKDWRDERIVALEREVSTMKRQREIENECKAPGGS